MILPLVFNDLTLMAAQLGHLGMDHLGTLGPSSHTTSGHVDHWAMFIQYLAGNPRLLHLRTVFQKQQEKTIPNEQVLFKFPLVFCWPKQVTWPRPDSEDGAIQTSPLNGKRCKEFVANLCILT